MFLLWIHCVCSFIFYLHNHNHEGKQRRTLQFILCLHRKEEELKPPEIPAWLLTASIVRSYHPYLTVRLHSDKPSPSPTGPIGTLNVPLNRFKFERLTSVSEFSRENAGRKAGRKTVAAAFRVFKQFYMKHLGTEMRGSWLSIGFPNCID